MLWGRGDKATSPFVAAALQLCQLQKAHAEELARTGSVASNGTRANGSKARAPRGGGGGGGGAAESAVAAEIEQAFAEQLEQLRPLFHAARALESSRMYSAKLHAALRYFRMFDDPMYEQLSAVVGRLNKQPRAASVVWRDPTLSTGRHDGGDGSYGGVGEYFDATADALARVRSAKHVQPSYAPSEEPAPHPDAVGAEVGHAGEVHASFSHRGHWVLREPGIAATRDERRVDPW